MTDVIAGPRAADRRFRAHRGPFWIAGAVLTGIVVIAAAGPPQLLLNHTLSEPLGLYRRIGARPSVGAIIAFPAPQTAFPYADDHMAYLHHEPLLKVVAASAGDLVCDTAGELVINGVVRAPIADHDSRGRALPRWRDCRRLRSGELFVFSNRVANSFDSRYFGPVPAASVLGVYRPWRAS